MNWLWDWFKPKPKVTKVVIYFDRVTANHRIVARGRKG